MIFVDTSVILDIVRGDAIWGELSANALEDARGRDQPAINAIVFAELCSQYERLEEVEALVSVLDLEMLPLPPAALFAASKAFRRYRRRSGTKTNVLPDFFIGAHAAVEGAELLTRDPRRIKSYFPSVMLISP